ncbi:MAG: 30S ribosomal protein S8 [Candidatus Woesearchaeota archaeon]
MAGNDTLANALSMLNQYDSMGKTTLRVQPVSSLIERVFRLLHENHYVGSYTLSTYGGHPSIVLQLLGRINKCGVIKPRFSVTVADYQKYEQRYLIAKDFGILIVSTPNGLMTHKEAIKKKLGGKLIAYCY